MLYYYTGASAIAYFSVIAFIFAVRYLDVLRYGFKLTWVVLGITIAAEVAGKLVMNAGIASQLRPRRYYTVPRETLDVLIGDVHELVNFIVIEAQRIVFAENVSASATVRIYTPSPAQVLISMLEEGTATDSFSYPLLRLPSALSSPTGSLRLSHTGVLRSSPPPSCSPCP